MNRHRTSTIVTITATLSALLAQSLPASAQFYGYYEYRRKPVLQRPDTRAIVGGEVYTPSRNTLRDATSGDQAPPARTDQPAGVGESVTSRPPARPTAAQCVAGCG